ncbi:MAG: hypothetical protein SGI73_19340 [Chloroflexota bacterium]|nr:hypothetical protein [Chloroflexota bacterium]
MQDVREWESGDAPSETSLTRDVPRYAITVELAAAVAIAVLALVLRLASLDSVPLTHAEAREALAAWRAVSPEAAGADIVPHSALNFVVQAFTFSTLGGAETSARLGTVLAGVALVLMPFAFRRLFGVGRALIFSLLLLASPVLLGASRFASPAVWAMLCAALLLWTIWRYNETRKVGFALGAAGAAAALILLSDPAGVILALILAGAGILTVLTNPIDEDEDEASDAAAPSWIRAFPWGAALGVAALLVFAVSTAFLLYPAGLSAAGEALGGALRGFVESYPNATPLFPTVIALFYEPFIALFALVGVIALARGGGMTAIERFLIAWVILGVFASLVYVGATPAHSLWLTMPLTALASSAGWRCIVMTTEDSIMGTPISARWIVAVAMIGLLFLVTLPFQDVARAMVNAVDLASVNVDPASAILVILAVLFLVVGYLLIASLWDARTALRGIGLGALIFGAVTSLGSGWVFSVTQSEDATSLWHQETTHRDLFLLRQTLIEVAAREEVGFTYYLPVYALTTDVSPLAWVLRDFNDTVFITDIAEAATQAVAVLPSEEAAPDLGAPYVGQDFVVGRRWAWRQLNALDAAAWWSQGQSRTPSLETDAVVLWLRQDVYQGVPFDIGANANVPG